MTTPLTDRAALIRNRARAMAAPVTFLQEAARDEIEDRLALVKKSFRNPAVIRAFGGVWDDFLPGAQVIDDQETLPLEQNGHDLVVHAMCLHWADDPVGQLIQARRALRPDGLFLGVMLGGETLHELRASLAQAEADLFGGLSPRVAPMAEIRDLGALLQRAGFALPVADSVRLTASYVAPLQLMQELRFMGEGNALHSRRRTPTSKALFQRASEIYVESFGEADGRVPATFEFIVLTGWAPDASQPQPLRPGSASKRLADALGAEETRLKD
ncbi:MAG: methyltransferase domain-containing protein [Roseovarius sp.]|uniref:methyltransferase domain-containing protein n=1 Tax=Roseovarius sp. TaxID=1486281 RepID=UPI0032EAD1E9